jgi:hypothetical protein
MNYLLVDTNFVWDMMAPSVSEVITDFALHLAVHDDESSALFASHPVPLLLVRLETLRCLLQSVYCPVFDNPDAIAADYTWVSWCLMLLPLRASDDRLYFEAIEVHLVGPFETRERGVGIGHIFDLRPDQIAGCGAITGTFVACPEYRRVLGISTAQRYSCGAV